MLSSAQREFLRMTIYQIWPRSFLDTNGDGVGDLPGVLAKLDYLRNLGVNTLWLSPCFQSPNDDNGYDVSDYRAIQPEFGTMEDLDALIAAVHVRGMKILLDLVPNHTSTAHRWFQESRRNPDGPYGNYYYWFDAPPNDWQSMFLGSAWEYDDVRGQYYLHSFAVSQADLNWEEPAVRREMREIVDFWVARGVDGFRIDTIDFISKDFSEGRNSFGPRLHEFIQELFGRPETAGLFTVGESFVTDIDEMSRHCASGRGELSTLILFDHLEAGRTDKFTPLPDHADDGTAGSPGMRFLRDHLIRWQRETAEHDLLYTLYSDSHDQPPMISRAADDGALRYESATCLAAMIYLLKGVPIIYQGQEIGVTSARYESIDSFDDVETINAYEEFCRHMSPEEALAKINFGSRDNARRPIAWTAGANGGFTSGTLWIPLHTRYREVNVEADLYAPEAAESGSSAASGSSRSVYRFYQALLKLRREHGAFLDGAFEVLSAPEDDCFVFTRALPASALPAENDSAGAETSDRKETWAVICNFGAEREIALPFECEPPALTNLGRTAADGIYAPYECAAAHVIR